MGSSEHSSGFLSRHLVPLRRDQDTEVGAVSSTPLEKLNLGSLLFCLTQCLLYGHSPIARTQSSGGFTRGTSCEWVKPEL